eukprot:scaffold897_cov402-Prasinococcus_capsulatus_cf.AAC.36
MASPRALSAGSHSAAANRHASQTVRQKGPLATVPRARLPSRAERRSEVAASARRHACFERIAQSLPHWGGSPCAAAASIGGAAWLGGGVPGTAVLGVCGYLAIFGLRRLALTSETPTRPTPERPPRVLVGREEAGGRVGLRTAGRSRPGPARCPAQERRSGPEPTWARRGGSPPQRQGASPRGGSAEGWRASAPASGGLRESVVAPSEGRSLAPTVSSAIGKERSVGDSPHKLSCASVARLDHS